MPPLGHVRALHSQSDLVADRQPLPAHLAGRGTTWAKAQLERCADSCNANHSTRRERSRACNGGVGAFSLLAEAPSTRQSDLQHHHNTPPHPPPTPATST